MMIIKNKTELFEVINRIHFDCHTLCRQAVGRYLPVAGNMGVFCHSEEEYGLLTRIREELTEASDNPDQKYFRFQQPLVIPSKDNIPDTTYTYLYIRRPDPTPYGRYTGDVDFLLEPKEYAQLKSSFLNGKIMNGAQIYNRPGWDTIQITDHEIEAVAYISTREMAEKARVKF